MLADYHQILEHLIAQPELRLSTFAPGEADEA